MQGKNYSLCKNIFISKKSIALKKKNFNPKKLCIKNISTLKQILTLKNLKVKNKNKKKEKKELAKKEKEKVCKFALKKNFNVKTNSVSKKVLTLKNNLSSKYNIQITQNILLRNTINQSRYIT